MKKYFLVLIIAMMTSCSDHKNKAIDFIEKNKHNAFTNFKNIGITARNRKDNVYHYSLFYFFTKKDTLIIPSYEFFDNFYDSDEKFTKSAYKLYEIKKKSYDQTLTPKEFAKKIAYNVDLEYKGLGVINYLHNSNRGEFIEFTISKNCKVFYLIDKPTLNSYWKSYFERLNKYDDRWFFICN